MPSRIRVNLRSGIKKHTELNIKRLHTVTRKPVLLTAMTHVHCNLVTHLKKENKKREKGIRAKDTIKCVKGS